MIKALRLKCANRNKALTRTSNLGTIDDVAYTDYREITTVWNLQ